MNESSGMAFVTVASEGLHNSITCRYLRLLQEQCITGLCNLKSVKEKTGQSWQFSCALPAL